MHPAFEQMLAFNRKHSESKEVYKKMQAWHLKNDNKNGVFCPLLEVMTFSPTVFVAYNSNKFTTDTLLFAQNLHLFGTWRNSLGIYKIDDDILNDVIKSPIPSETPVIIFERLPEFCVYLDISYANIIIENHLVLGFWAMLDIVMHENRKIRILRLVFHFNDIDNMHTEIELTIDSTMTIEQAIISMYQKNHDFGFSELHELLSSDLQISRIALSCLLWLCADEPDITNIVGEPLSKDKLRMPRYQVNRKTGVFVVPPAPFFYDIGKRLGGEIREFNEKLTSSDSRVSSRKRPHIRRGHWHGHWHGTGQAKEFKVRWQPAVFVNSSI